MAYDMSEIDGEHFTEPCMVVNVEDIQKLPPITSQPKIGHWIGITNKNETVIAIRCDNCKKSPKNAIRSDFCPNCGAKMEVEE